MNPLDKPLPTFNFGDFSPLQDDEPDQEGEDLFSSLRSTIDSLTLLIKELKEEFSTGEIIKSQLEIGTKQKYRESMLSKGVNPDTLPESLKTEVQIHQKRYVDTVFAVYQKRIAEGDCHEDAVRALNKRSIKWMENEEGVFGQDIGHLLGIASNPVFKQRLSREHTRVVLGAKSEARKAEITLKSFEGILGSISDMVKLASEKGCLPSEVGEIAPKKELSEKERQDLIDELIKEDEARKGKKKAKKDAQEKQPPKGNRKKRLLQHLLVHQVLQARVLLQKANRN